MTMTTANMATTTMTISDCASSLGMPHAYRGPQTGRSATP